MLKKIDAAMKAYDMLANFELNESRLGQLIIEYSFVNEELSKT